MQLETDCEHGKNARFSKVAVAFYGMNSQFTVDGVLISVFGDFTVSPTLLGPGSPKWNGKLLKIKRGRLVIIC